MPPRPSSTRQVKGRKRHILTDTGGLLVGAIVHIADIQGRDGAPLLLASIRSGLPWLHHVFADGGYAGDKLEQALALAWLNRNPRLAKDFEATIESALGWLMIASVQPLSRGLART